MGWLVPIWHVRFFFRVGVGRKGELGGGGEEGGGGQGGSGGGFGQMVGIVAVIIARVAISTAVAALAANADAPSIMTRRRIATPILRIIFVGVFIAIVRGPQARLKEGGE